MGKNKNKNEKQTLLNIRINRRRIIWNSIKSETYKIWWDSSIKKDKIKIYRLEWMFKTDRNFIIEVIKASKYNKIERNF